MLGAASVGVQPALANAVRATNITALILVLMVVSLRVCVMIVAQQVPRQVDKGESPLIKQTKK